MAVAGYEIEKEGGAPIDVGNPLPLVGGKHQFLVEDLTSETIYEFRVRSYDVAGNRGEWSPIVAESTDGPPVPTNWALASNGSTATGSQEPSGFPASAAINGLRHPNNAWGSGGGWSSADAGPQSLEIDFGASRNINRIDVFGLADAINYNTDPTLADTFTLYGLIEFNLDYWDGDSWEPVAGTSVTSNDKVWKQFTGLTVTTTKIRLNVVLGGSTQCRVVEVEAWGDA